MYLNCQFLWIIYYFNKFPCRAHLDYQEQTNHHQHLTHWQLLILVHSSIMVHRTQWEFQTFTHPAKLVQTTLMNKSLQYYTTTKDHLVRIDILSLVREYYYSMPQCSQCRLSQQNIGVCPVMLCLNNKHLGAILFWQKIKSVSDPCWSFKRKLGLVRIWILQHNSTKERERTTCYLVFRLCFSGWSSSDYIYQMLFNVTDFYGEIIVLCCCQGWVIVANSYVP